MAKTRLLEIALQMTNELCSMQKQAILKNKKLQKKAEVLKKKLQEKTGSGQ